MSGIRRDKYDSVVSDLVRESVGHCQSCGKSGCRLENAHIFSRRHRNTRWDLQNCLCLCSGCHRKYGENPILFTNWLECTFGKGYLDVLTEKHHTIKKWKPAEMKEMYAHYRAELKRIRDGGTDPVSYQ